MKKYLLSIAALTGICLVISALLAVTNYITAPIIAKNQEEAAKAALIEVMPGETEFSPIDLSAYDLPASVIAAHSAKNGGYVLQMNVTGYKTNMIIMCGVDASGTVTGAKCLSSGETLKHEKTYGENFVGKTADGLAAVDTIAGATKTTAAYKSAVRDALNAAIIFSGGSVDIRTPEQILADSLAAALPQGDAFTRAFITEDISGVDAVYTAENGAGAVYVVGEAYIAVDAEGNVLTETDADTRTLVAEAAARVLSSTKEEIDIAAYPELPTAVQKAYKTASGNFVVEVRGSGFGITGDKYYEPSGEHIYIRASATADGRLLAVETISQAETDGVGSVCADPAFYTQFNGKDETNYKIDAIAGVTKTVDGYNTAILRVFEAVKILKGRCLL